MDDVSTQYSVPEHLNLTPGGLRALENVVARYRRGLVAELERQAVDKGGEPELTADNVTEACAAYSQRDRVERAEIIRKTNWSVLSVVLLMISTTGLGIMPPFLNSLWQYGLFYGFLAVGAGWLSLMWISHRRGRNQGRR